jgi:putative transposase
VPGLRRDAAAVNTRWCGDITYIPTWEGWLYLATVIDIASRRIVGLPWPSTCAPSWLRRADHAIAARDPAPGVIVHADRGCQYTSSDDALLAGDLAVRLSTGRTGQCWDNALAESFFASLKGECLDRQPWPTRAGARRATVDYIAGYNGPRLHSALGDQTPTSTSPPPARRSLLGQPDRATSPIRQTGATPPLDCLAGRSVLPLDPGTVDTEACRESPRGKR